MYVVTCAMMNAPYTPSGMEASREYLTFRLRIMFAQAKWCLKSYALGFYFYITFQSGRQPDIPEIDEMAEDALHATISAGEKCHDQKHTVDLNINIP